MRIVIEDKIINIYSDEREKPIYSFRKAELAHTIDDHGHKISDWIHHLMSKTWIEEHILYKLAELIQAEFPNNDIDWVETFFPVEKKSYLNHVKKTKRLTSTDEKTPVDFSSLMESIQTGIEEQNDFVNGQILKIVKTNLEKYGLE